MEAFMEILATALLKGEVQVVFPNLRHSAEELVELRCYEAVQKIKAVMQDDSLEDPTCFQKIEEILYVLDELGVDSTPRHDF